MNIIKPISQAIHGKLTMAALFLFLCCALSAQGINKELEFQHLVLSHPPGYYSEAIDLEILCPDNHSIYYTLDGSAPLPGSPGTILYESPLALDNRSEEDNGISIIQPVAEDSPIKYDLPKEKIFKANIVRARCFSLGQPASEILTASYFISGDMQGRYTMPIISLTTANENLFNYDTGIYVPGVNHVPVEIKDKTGNYFMKGADWEREVHIEFFSTNGEREFSQDAGMRIHGGNTREAPQKSLRIYFRSEYGDSRLEANVFPGLNLEYYKRLVLETCDQRWKKAIFSDDLIHDLASEFTDGQTSRPCITFINGEYWGIYKLRERIDRYYLATHYDVDDDEVDLLESALMWVNEGSNEDYSNLIDFVMENDLSDMLSYNYVSERMDINQFIDYVLTEIYFSNYDWPVGNIKYWKEQSDNAKWRWLLYDLDQGFLEPKRNMFEHATLEDGPAWPNPDISTLLLRSLLMNEEFEKLFVGRMLYHLDHGFKAQTVLDKINEYVAIYDPELDEHFARWSRGGNRNWLMRNVNLMKEFAIQRPYYIKHQMAEFFNIDTIRISSFEDEANYQVFPNPFGSHMTIEFREPNMETYSYKVIDLYGKTLLSGELPAEKSLYYLDMSLLPENVYILRLESAADVQYKTILKVTN